MRKLVLLGMLFMCSYVNAQRVEWPNRLWKASTTFSTDTNVLISSFCPCIFHGISIDSPTVGANGSNVDSYFALYDASAAPATGGYVTPTISTRIFLALDNAFATVGTQHFYDIPISSQIVYNKQGAARITILWDWFVLPSSTNTNHYKN